MNPKEQHIIDELKKTAPQLPSDQYFEELKAAVLSKLPQAKIVPLYKRWWMIGSAAASVALVIGLFLFRDEAPQQQAALPDWNSVSKEEMLAYIEENIDDFEAETLAQHLTEIPEWEAAISTDTTLVATSSVRLQQESSDNLFDELDDKEILEYLQEEAIELDDELLIGS